MPNFWMNEILHLKLFKSRYKFSVDVISMQGSAKTIKNKKWQTRVINYRDCNRRLIIIFVIIQDILQVQFLLV